MRFLSLMIPLLILSGLCPAQEYPPDQSNPQSTLYKHYYYLSEDSYNPAVSAQTFGSSGIADQQLAIRLRQILDGKGIVPRFGQVPSESDFTDSSSGRHEYHPFPRYPEIYLEKKENRWYFSEHTKEYIPRLYQQIFPFGSGWLMNLLPGRGGEKFLGLKSWQWLGLLLLILTGLFLHKIFTWIIELITRRLIQSTSVSKDFRIAIHRMAIPFSYLFLVQILDWLYPSLLLPATPGHLVNLAFRIMEPVFLTVGLYRLVDVIALILKRRAEKTETTLDDQLVPLFRKFFKVIMVIFGAVVLLNNLDFNLTALIAGVSIGGLALALAAQDTIRNMFGSLMIFVDKPFQIGDLVRLEGITGKVEEVGFRSTRIRTLGSSLVSIPNGKVVDMVIDNLGGRQYRKFQTQLSLSAGTPAAQVELLVRGIRELAVSQSRVMPESVEVSFQDIHHHALIIGIDMHFTGNDPAEELKGRQEILLGIIRLAGELDIRFAAPPIPQK